MLNINTNTKLFDLTEGDLSTAGDFQLDLQAAITALDGLPGTWTPQSITSTRIVMEQAGNTLTIDGLSLTGISSFQQFEQVISELSTNGDVTGLQLEDDTGADIIGLGFTSTGVVAASGNQTIQIDGTNLNTIEDVDNLGQALKALFPRSFGFITNGNGSPMTDPQALATLATLGITDVRLLDGSSTVLDLSITATEITVSTEAFTTRVEGSIPTTDLAAVYAFLERLEPDLIDMVRHRDVLDITPLYGSFPISSITVTGPDGELFSLNGDIAGAASGSHDPNAATWQLSGSDLPETLTYLVDATYAHTHQITAGGGDDTIILDLDPFAAEQDGRNILGQDSLTLALDGGAGVDLLQLTSTEQVDFTIDLSAGSISLDGNATGSIAGISRIDVADMGTFSLTGTADDETLALTYAINASFHAGAGTDRLDLTGYELRDGAGTLLQSDLTLADYITNGLYLQDDDSGVFTLTNGNLTLSEVEELVLFDATYNPLALEGDAASGSTAAADIIGNTGLTVTQTLNGGGGDDRVNGGSGDDILDGGYGDDRVIGGTGSDTIYGGDGTDILNGGDGDDFIYGGDSVNDKRDTIFAGAGNDVIDGGYGNDLIYGMDGDDTITGGAGADELQGQAGNDTINGAAFADTIFGNDGIDFINGGFGSDLLNGGSGGDTFYHQGIADHGSDWIQDFNDTEGDRLLVGLTGATGADFQVNYTHTQGADGTFSGSASVQEAFIIYKPSGHILFALIDGAGLDDILLRVAGGDTYDLVF